MNCVLCETGILKEGRTTITLTRGDAILLFKQVPALICDQCGHYNLESPIAKRVFNMANNMVDKGAELEIFNLMAV